MAKNCQNINGHQVVLLVVANLCLLLQLFESVSSLTVCFFSAWPLWLINLLLRLPFCRLCSLLVCVCVPAIFRYGFVSKLWPLPFLLLSNKLSRHMLCVSVCAMAYLRDSRPPPGRHSYFCWPPKTNWRKSCVIYNEILYTLVWQLGSQVYWR